MKLVVEIRYQMPRLHLRLSASARAVPGTWAYPPISTSLVDEGMRWNRVASENTKLPSIVKGLLSGIAIRREEDIESGRLLQ